MSPTVQSHHIIFTHVSVSDRTVRRAVVYKTFLAKLCAFLCSLNLLMTENSQWRIWVSGQHILSSPPTNYT